MSHFANSLRPARCFTGAEAQALLDASGKHASTFRDHMIFAVAFGTGLREHEIRALDVGDIFDGAGNVRRHLPLRIFKGHKRDGARPQEARIPAPLARKLAKLYEMKVRAGEDAAPTAPLFGTRKKGRICDRHMRRLLKAWLEVAGVDTSLRFHELRHTAVTGIYEATLDVVATQRFARHADIRTTIGYVHSSTAVLDKAVDGLRC